MPQTFREYQKLAVRTSGARDHKFTPSPFFSEMPVPDGPVVVRLNTAVLGLVGEVGEFADLLKKVVGHGHTPDPVKFGKEGGDVFWYLAELSDAFGIEMEDRDVDTAQQEAALAILGGQLTKNEKPYEVAIEYVLAAAFNAGQVAGIYNALMQGTEADWASVQILLANVSTYVATALYLMGLPLWAVLEHNIAKLKERYPDGFSEERSINRVAD